MERKHGGVGDSLDAFYEDVDRGVRRIQARHRDRLRCRRGCHGCCIDALSVFEIEAEYIRRHHADLLRRSEPHPEGACAFLDAWGACRIYEHRPYVCRTQGLPLRWIDQAGEDGSYAEMRDICPHNDRGHPVEALAPADCWTIGPFEERLARLQRAAHSGGRRVPLRRLFLRR